MDGGFFIVDAMRLLVWEKRCPDMPRGGWSVVRDVDAEPERFAYASSDDARRQAMKLMRRESGQSIRVVTREEANDVLRMPAYKAAKASLEVVAVMPLAVAPILF